LPSTSLPPGKKDKRPGTPRPTALWWFLGALLVLAIGQALFLTPGGRQIPYSEFKSLVRIQPGQAYRGDEVANTVRLFSDLFGSFGYAFARVEQRPEIDRATGQVVVVLESMKLFTSLSAGIDGVVADIACQPGETVQAGKRLALIEPPSA